MLHMLAHNKMKLFDKTNMYTVNRSLISLLLIFIVRRHERVPKKIHFYLGSFVHKERHMKDDVINRMAGGWLKWRSAS